MRAARGFTLVEILVALTLFAVVGGTLLQLFQQGLRQARIADDHGHAVLLARSKLTELQAHSHLSPGELSGSFPDGYRWRALLEAGKDDDDEANRWLAPLWLTLTVSWGDRDDSRDFVLQSLLLTQQVQER